MAMGHLKHKMAIVANGIRNAVELGAETMRQSPLQAMDGLSRQLKLRPHEWAMMVAAFILPMHRIAASYSASILLAYWLFSGSFRRALPGFFTQRYLWPLWAFLILQLVGMLYTQNVDAGWYDLKIKLSLFLFPLFMAGAPQLSPRGYRLSLGAFVAGTVVSALIALSVAANRAPAIGKSAFFYVELLQYAHMHPSYFALYLCSSVLILFRFFQITRGRLRISCAVAILFLLVFLMLLSARAQILIMVVVGNIALLFYLAGKGKLFRGLIILLVLNASAIGLLSQMEFTRQRLEGLKLMEQSEIPNSANSRLQIWTAARNILSDNLWLGVGTGDVESSLLEQYKATDFKMGIEHRFNAHNQYLHTWLSSGIAGLIALLSCLLFPAIRALRSGRSLFPALLLFFALSMLVESMLESQMGIGWFAFFLGFFCFQDRSVEDDPIADNSII